MLDVGEDVLVGTHDRRRLGLVRDLFAEYVDRRQLALCIYAADGLARVLQLGPGDVTLGELLHQRPRDGRKHANERAVEDRHELTILRSPRQSRAELTCLAPLALA